MSCPSSHQRASRLDAVFTVISIAVAVVCNPMPVIKRVWPHLTVLGLFGGFVAWNGGVVLGDKSNHVATIHLAQMLYIWPIFAFFQAPLLLPSLWRLLAQPRDALGLSTGSAIRLPPAPSAHDEFSDGGGTTKPSEKPSEALRIMTCTSFTKPLRAFVAAATLLVFALVVRYNTIVHPFTLADNRHYLFYVFRYTILRSVAVRHLLVFPYAACLLLLWNTLCGSIAAPTHSPKFCCQSRFVNHPFFAAPQPCPVAQEPDKVHPNRSTAVVVYLDDRASRASEPVAASTALLVVLATALSLVTAPLVEPRYFIMPWIVWRLLIPAWQPTPRWRSMGGLAGAISQKHDVRLFAETAWFAIINLVTVYVFIRCPYVWRASDGSALDGGRMQRFMW